MRVVKQKIHIKTPISYYGGKQQMLNRLLPLIPTHTTYCEPFCGGAALYWAKEPSLVEVINDKNRELINFYQCLKNRFKQLKPMLEASLHSRAMHSDARQIYKNPTEYTEVERAWAVWMMSCQTFLSKLDGAWGYAIKSNKSCIKVGNSIKRIAELYQERLLLTTIECDDAVKVFIRFDREETFTYLDPPYINTNQGHYGGYKEAEYRVLLEAGAEAKGKFLLSSFPNEVLKEFVEKHNWYYVEVDMHKSSSNKGRKIEALAANYPII